MKTVTTKFDKRKLVLKQKPLTDVEMKRLEKGGKLVNPDFFMAKPKAIPLKTA